MKKIILVLSLTLCIGIANAQTSRLSLNALGGYVFNDKISADPYYGTLKGGFQWQVGLEAGLRKFYGLELYYVRQDTHADVYGPLVNKSVGTGLNYIMLGGKRYANLGSDNVMAWGGLSLGVAFGNNKDDGQTFSKFAWGLRVGLKAKPNKESRVGFLFQAQLLSAVQAAGGGFYVGTGGGGVGVSTYSTIYQFGLSGGLAIQLK